jgi:hypothetical protein
MKILSLGITQHFTNEVNWILDLPIGVRHPPFHDDSHTNHIACSPYIELQVFMGLQGYQSGWGSQVFLQVLEGLLCLLSPLEFVLLLEEFKEWESPDAESRDEPALVSHAPHQLLDIMEVLSWLNLGDSHHLL